VNLLEEKQQNYQLDHFLNQLDRTDLLICDELGYLSFSRAPENTLSLKLFHSIPFRQSSRKSNGPHSKSPLIP